MKGTTAGGRRPGPRRDHDGAGARCLVHGPGVRRIGAMLLAVACASMPAHAQASPPVIVAAGAYAPVATALTQFIEHEIAVHGIPALSIALVDDQQVIWARGFGEENARTHAPATANTVYRVGSVSKLFTDIGIMQLVERGLLDLDAPVQRYLSTFRPDNRSGTPITLRQLTSHRSGLVREPPLGHYFDDRSPTLAATVASLRGTALVYPPNTRTKYSNAAIAAVGAVLERRSGLPFAVYLQRAVLAPMGLTSSSFDPSPSLKARTADAVMWNYQDRPFPAPTFALGMAPAGSMYSTMPDLGRFLSALFAGGRGAGGRVLKPETLQQMWTPQFAPSGATRGYGIGFGLTTLDGARVVEHGGAIYGFATQLTAMPDEKLGVAVSAAKDGMNGLTARIANESLRLLRAVKSGAPLPSVLSTTAVPRALAVRLAGEYGSADSSVAIAVHDSSVVLTVSFRETHAGLRVLRGDTLTVDDGLGFGGRAWLSGDTLHLNDRMFTRRPPRAALPPDAPARWRGLIGEYGWDHNVLYILEREGRLHALIEWFFDYPLTEISENVYAFPPSGLYPGERIEFTRDASGRATVATAAGIGFARRTWIGEDGGIFRITPAKPVAVLRREALAASPPAEQGAFRAQELTELVSLDSTIKLDIRYASDRNFLSAPMYTQARAFLQKPAAEALVRAHRALAKQGYGLLIHDGYRPWYVTKMFWDGTPPAQHAFVADPASGSRHNRGCAVDLTMYDLRTGEPVVTTGGYDEMSDRSYPKYPGGTSRQRALREILRAAMEAEGFSVYDAEWWHFDYKDWRSYRIGNETFEQLAR
jgi:CubicO group peptidase (beta-lactamase class C family)/D-alanyl-D-alanine dipeptidase